MSSWSSDNRDGYVSFGHPSILLKLASGKSVAVDTGVVELVRVINGVPGIETKGSCQGEPQGYGYVQFAPNGDEANIQASIYFLYHMMKHMHAAWVMHQYRATDVKKLTDQQHADGGRFKFTTELGNGYVMKWAPEIYPTVLEAARKTAAEMK